MPINSIYLFSITRINFIYQGNLYVDSNLRNELTKFLRTGQN